MHSLSPTTDETLDLEELEVFYLSDGTDDKRGAGIAKQIRRSTRETKR